MPAFEVQLNGKKLCTAGMSEGGVVSVILHWVGGIRPGSVLNPGELSLRVGGLISRTDEHVEWTSRDLKVGDELIVRIAEVSKISKAKAKTRESAGETRRRRKAYVRRMAKEFGWKIER